jgi:hypothetical protein
VQTYQWESVDAVLRDRMTDAEKAVDEVTTQAKESFYGWLRIGQGLADMQAAAIALAYGPRSNKRPSGKAYNPAYEIVAARYPKLASIDAATRSNAIWMHKNRSALESWHAQLGDDNARRSVNHPATVRRQYESWIKRLSAEAKPQETQPSSAARQMSAIEQDLRDRIGEGDKAADVARVLLEYPESIQKQVHDILAKSLGLIEAGRRSGRFRGEREAAETVKAIAVGKPARKAASARG